MAFFEYSGIGITAIAAAVPKNVFNNINDNVYFTEKEVGSVIKMTGIVERRVADAKMCASDLCFAAAEKLLEDNQINREEIDVLIFISQTPDYRMPATGIILQNRLSLGKHCAAMDINLGCSGYIYGLNLAYSYANHTSIRKVLLLNGETRTKVYSFKDKSTGLLFGDGGTATLIEAGEKYTKAHFSLHADGKRWQAIMIKNGGYRNPSSLDSILEKEYPDGSIRTDEQGVMDGPCVFDFTIQEVPESIKYIMEKTGTSIDDIDVFLLHQANKFITNHIAKKLGLPMEKIPYSLHKFGNTSSVSIPLTIVSELREQCIGDNLQTLMCGFGVGLSWGTGLVELNSCQISELLEI
jgi:3-oxoacyl-[acyl-carrier-protein] synthase-3